MLMSLVWGGKLFLEWHMTAGYCGGYIEGGRGQEKVGQVKEHCWSMVSAPSNHMDDEQSCEDISYKKPKPKLSSVPNWRNILVCGHLDMSSYRCVCGKAFVIWLGLFPARRQILESRSCLGLSLCHFVTLTLCPFVVCPFVRPCS